LREFLAAGVLSRIPATALPGLLNGQAEVAKNQVQSLQLSSVIGNDQEVCEM